LRVTEKKGERPHYIKKIVSKKAVYQKSLAHILLFEKLYGLKADKTNNDGLKDKIIASGYDVA
jgi:hypothetical protein